MHKPGHAWKDFVVFFLLLSGWIVLAMWGATQFPNHIDATQKAMVK